MRDAFDIRSHVPLLAGNLYALPSQGSMAFKLPSFGLERTKRSSPLDDFPQFSWSELADKQEIGRGSFGCVFTAKTSDGDSVVVKKLLRQHVHERERRLVLKEAQILKSLQTTTTIFYSFTGRLIPWLRGANRGGPESTHFKLHMNENK